MFYRFDVFFSNSKRSTCQPAQQLSRKSISEVESSGVTREGAAPGDTLHEVTPELNKKCG